MPIGVMLNCFNGPTGMVLGLEKPLSSLGPLTQSTGAADLMRPTGFELGNWDESAGCIYIYVCSCSLPNQV